jgi:hypothetical protein
MIWKRPPNETYDERRERILKASIVAQDSQIDFANVKVEKTSFRDDGKTLK